MLVSSSKDINIKEYARQRDILVVTLWTTKMSEKTEASPVIKWSTSSKESLFRLYMNNTIENTFSNAPATITQVGKLRKTNWGIDVVKGELMLDNKTHQFVTFGRAALFARGLKSGDFVTIGGTEMQPKVEPLDITKQPRLKLTYVKSATMENQLVA